MKTKKYHTVETPIEKRRKIDTPSTQIHDGFQNTKDKSYK